MKQGPGAQAPHMGPTSKQRAWLKPNQAVNSQDSPSSDPFPPANLRTPGSYKTLKKLRCILFAQGNRHSTITIKTKTQHAAL